MHSYGEEDRMLHFLDETGSLIWAKFLELFLDLEHCLHLLILVHLVKMSDDNYERKAEDVGKF